MKIAIVKLSALGDIVNSMFVLQFIKKYYPTSKIDWIVEKRFKGILENNPHIDQIHTINLNKAKKNKSKIDSNKCIKNENQELHCSFFSFIILTLITLNKPLELIRRTF